MQTGITAKHPNDVSVTIPAWARDARWYQVVVSRFCNGDTSNDPEGTLPWTTHWPAKAKPSTGDNGLDGRQYGGDLQGLQKRLTYLKDLGVNTLYLTSIFQPIYGPNDAPGATGTFSAVDLRHVDDSLGVKDSLDRITGETLDPKSWTFSESDRVFLAFLTEAHQQGFRVIVEAVLGDVRQAVGFEPDLEKRLFAVTRRWMDPNGDGRSAEGVDGWVLREPEKRSHKLWKRWRKNVKAINPNALLVGDIQGDPTPWLGGDEFDTTINYDVANAIRQFFSSGHRDYTLKKFFADLAAINPCDDLSSRLAALNPLSSPHMGRLLSVLSQSAFGEADGKGVQTSMKPSEGARSRWRLATAFQHFYLGAPMTYYGDEVGMVGGPGAHSRAPMWWNDLPNAGSKAPGYRDDFASLVKWLHIRREIHPSLRRGDFRSVLLDEEHRILAFARSLPGDEVILVMNYGDTKQKVMLPAGRPGQLISVLTPALNPPPQPQGSSKQPGTPQNRIRPPTRVGPLLMSGSRQLINAEGLARIWVAPMSIRVVLVKDDAPR